MEKTELLEWFILLKQLDNGYHMEKSDWLELIRLNHIIMEKCHAIHNKNMER